MYFLVACGTHMGPRVGTPRGGVCQKRADYRLVISGKGVASYLRYCVASVFMNPPLLSGFDRAWVALVKVRVCHRHSGRNLARMRRPRVANDDIERDSLFARFRSEHVCSFHSESIVANDI